MNGLFLLSAIAFFLGIWNMMRADLKKDSYSERITKLEVKVFFLEEKLRKEEKK